MNIQALTKQLKVHEGLRLRTYRDTKNVLTVGYGWNLQQHSTVPILGWEVHEHDSITEEEAETLLIHSIKAHVQELYKHLDFAQALSENRQLVLGDMAFNMGVPTLLTFKNTLRAMRDGRYHHAAQGMAHSLWATQVKSRAKRLTTMMMLDVDFNTAYDLVELL